MKKKLIIYGDSIMRGVYFDKTARKYHYIDTSLADALSSKYKLEIINRSRFGSTIKKGFEFIKKTIEKDLPADFAILEFGGNDCDFDWFAVADNPYKNFEPHTPIDQFIELYGQTASYLYGKGIEVLAMLPPPISGDLYLKRQAELGIDTEKLLIFLKDASQMSRFQELYSVKTGLFASESKIPLIDARTPFLKKIDFNELISDDGIHPSPKGHELIYSQLDKFFENKFSV